MSIKIQSNLKGVSAEMKNLQDTIKRTSTVVTQFQKAYVQSLTQIRQAIEGVEDKSKKMREELEKQKKINFDNIVKGVKSFLTVFKEAAGSSFSLEKAMANLSIQTGITGGQLELLEEHARKVGVESGIGATKAAEAYSVLAKKIDVSEIKLQDFNNLQKNTITLSQATGTSMDVAAAALATTINQFGLSADQASQVINVLTAASQTGSMDISNLSQSLNIVGAAAASMGLSVESTAGALAVLSQANVEGAVAGESLKAIITGLTEQLGVDLSETSLSTALEALKPLLADSAALVNLFGAENLAVAESMIQNAAAIGQVTTLLGNTTLAYDQAAIQTETNAFKMAQLQQAIDNIKISFVEATGSAAPWIAVLGENIGAIGSLFEVGQGVISMFSTLKTLMEGTKLATMASTAAMKIAAVATQTWSTVQAVLNGIIAANPIGAIITAIAALAAGVIYCYNNFEGFREVCDKVWSAIKTLGKAIVDNLVNRFKGLTELAGNLGKVFRALFEGDFKGAMESAKDSAASFGKMMTGIDPNEVFDKFQGKGSQSAEEFDKATLSVGKYKEAVKGIEPVDISAIGTGTPDTTKNTAAIKPSIPIIPQLDINLKDELEEKVVKATKDFDKPLPINVELKPVGLDLDKLKIEVPKELPGQIEAINSYSSGVESTGTNLKNMQGALNDTGALMKNLSGVVGEGAAGWLGYGANIINSVAQALPAIAQVIGGNIAMAFAGATAQSQTVGFPLNLIALATSLAAIGAAVAQIPAFANGGIVYGPTLGLFGEYSGAQNNPEVVAPLNKLRSMIQPAGNMGGNVEFRIEGRTLVGMFNKMNEVNRRTR